MNEPLSEFRLSSIRESLEKITEPLVFAPQECDPNCRCQRRLFAGTEIRTRKVVADVYGAQYSEFFASAPNMVRDLLGEVVRLKEELAEARAGEIPIDGMVNIILRLRQRVALYRKYREERGGAGIVSQGVQCSLHDMSWALHEGHPEDDGYPEVDAYFTALESGLGPFCLSLFTVAVPVQAVDEKP